MTTTIFTDGTVLSILDYASYEYDIPTTNLQSEISEDKSAIDIFNDMTHNKYDCILFYGKILLKKNYTNFCHIS